MITALGFVLRFNVQVIFTFTRNNVSNQMFMLKAGMDELYSLRGRHEVREQIAGRAQTWRERRRFWRHLDSTGDPASPCMYG